MSMSAEWQKAYARQASADFGCFESLQGMASIPACHRLLFLQMACEKICKAHLIEAGTSPLAVQSSHAYVAKNLSLVLRNEIEARAHSTRAMQAAMQNIRQLAGEIELLNPSVDRNGQRPDNCEYPWMDQAGAMHSPLDWHFVPADLLLRPDGRLFLMLLRLSIDRLLLLS